MSDVEVKNHSVLMVIAWLWVGLPFAYGLYQLIVKVVQLFQS
ncbi:MFS transporter small subunit [Kutzneria chonburiensis]|uniref:Uncharacterized protein n=1 Tax=Kutzneria chonburiensis TaxID=1483604 RepID=A0ABV6N6L5_9PSEU|nr:hypothetical protein [Kutzneria chonburiensis]